MIELLPGAKQLPDLQLPAATFAISACTITALLTYCSATNPSPSTAAIDGSVPAAASAAATLACAAAATAAATAVGAHVSGASRYACVTSTPGTVLSSGVQASGNGWPVCLYDAA
jgi:hypothetical protein